MKDQVCRTTHATLLVNDEGEKSPRRQQRKANNLNRAVWPARYRQGSQDPEVAQTISNIPRRVGAWEI
jgi:hypothetical protein